MQDDGLEAIIIAIATHNRILELNLSSNKIGSKSARALGQFIGKPDCPLVSLCLRYSFAIILFELLSMFKIVLLMSKILNVINSWIV